MTRDERDDPSTIPPRPTQAAQPTARNTVSAVASLLPGDRVAIGAAVHEIQNVLTSVLGWVELAQSGDAAAVARALPVLRRGVLRASGLVGSLVDPVTAFGVRDERFDARAVVTAVCDLLEARCASLGIALQRSVPDEPVEAQGDADRVEQVLTNLVLNGMHAIEASRTRGGTAGVVTVTARASSDRVDVAVRDDGIGIDAKTRARIFEPYFTTRAPGPARGSVTGMGLAVSRTLTEAMGAHLDVESAPGAGTTMTLSLRRPRASMDLALPVSVPGTETRLRPGARVVVVDDDPSIRELLEVALALRGARVVVTTSLDDARGLVARGEIDVILVDETLGADTSGAAFLLEMELVAPRVGRVLMTGAPSVDHVPAAARGIVVRKPFLLDDVVRALAVALQER